MDPGNCRVIVRQYEDLIEASHQVSNVSPQGGVLSSDTSHCSGASTEEQTVGVNQCLIRQRGAGGSQECEVQAFWGIISEEGGEDMRKMVVAQWIRGPSGA